jgi:osmotically inducible lipoprotein OsmB
MRMVVVIGLTAMLAACGQAEKDRAMSGAAIGAGTGAVLGPVGVVTGGAIGAATGALTESSDFNLGTPWWRK